MKAECLKTLAITFLTCLTLFPGVASARNDPTFTTDFRLGDCDFESTGENPYFILRPGRRLILENEEEGERLVITVLHETKRITLPGIGSVTTRIVEERETVDGRLVEVSRNFFAVCDETSDIFYFGEDVDIFHPDGTITHDGAWRAGKPDGDGLAEPGIIMPGRFLLGSRYFQEIADDIALDRAENVEMGLEVETEAGTFQGCVRVIETSPLEPHAESEKIYCPGVGLVADGDLELVEIIGDEDDD